MRRRRDSEQLAYRTPASRCQGDARSRPAGTPTPAELPAFFSAADAAHQRSRTGGNEIARSAKGSLGVVGEHTHARISRVTPLPDQAADHFFFLPAKVVQYPSFFAAPMVQRHHPNGRIRKTGAIELISDAKSKNPPPLFTKAAPLDSRNGYLWRETRRACQRVSLRGPARSFMSRYSPACLVTCPASSHK